MSSIAARTRSPAPADLARIGEFLGAATPGAWVDAALARLPDLLVDHANCEKKAAATAISLMTRYGDRPDLAARMSRLAREELRHFEQVQKILLARGLARRRIRASRYAARLHDAVAREEPRRLVDLLVIGAFIEARSCERFALLAPRLEPPLAGFYSGLLAAEARHFEQYLALAGRYCGDLTAGELEARIEALRRVENALATEPDTELRFHSGPPVHEVATATAQRGRASRL